MSCSGPWTVCPLTHTLRCSEDGCLSCTDYHRHLVTAWTSNPSIVQLALEKRNEALSLVAVASIRETLSAEVRKVRDRLTDEIDSHDKTRHRLDKADNLIRRLEDEIDVLKSQARERPTHHSDDRRNEHNKRPCLDVFRVGDKRPTDAPLNPFSAPRPLKPSPSRGSSSVASSSGSIRTDPSEVSSVPLPSSYSVSECRADMTRALQPGRVNIVERLLSIQRSILLKVDKGLPLNAVESMMP